MPSRRPLIAVRPRRRSATAGESLEQRKLLSGVPAEVRTIDGTGNATDDAGAAHSTLIRLAAADYADGTGSPAGADRASARTISNAVAAQEHVTLNTQGRTDFLWLWGQFLDHDLGLTEGSHEPANIAVPTGDPFFDPQATGTATIGMTRSAAAAVSSPTEPREQSNAITAFIDGSNVYGSDPERAAALRTFSGGRLKVTATPGGDLLPMNLDGLPNEGGDGPNLFLAGDVRANENIYLIAMHTLWVREHNRIAGDLAAGAPALSDEAIYQQARRVVVGQLQAITYEEWLPALLGRDAIGDYQGHDPAVDPSLANEFSTAAFRFGHSLLPSTLHVAASADGTRAATTIDLLDAFFRPDRAVSLGIDNLLAGAAAGQSSELDELVVGDLRNFLFGAPGQGGMDLVSLNIQRGRDHGLADLNTTREAIGLPRVTDWPDISADPSVQAKLASVYDSVDDVDLWVGGLAEDPVAGSMLGATFHTIVADQFVRLRDGDRFWYERDFSGRERDVIAATRLSDVISRNTSHTLPGNVFVDESKVAPTGMSALLATARGVDRIATDADGRYRRESLRFRGDLAELPVDLDGDGQADPVAVGAETVQVGFAGADPLKPLEVVTLQLGRRSTVLGGDFDGDGVDELVSFDHSSGWWTVHDFGGGARSTRWGRWGTRVDWLDPVVGDFDGDGRDDVAARNSASGELFVARSVGFEFVTTRWGRWSADVPWESVQRGDLDGDGRDEIIGRNPYGGMVYAAMSDGAAFVNRSVARLSSAYDWTDLVVGDFNGDGADDLAGRLAHTGAWYCGSLSSGAAATEGMMNLWGRWSVGIDWTSRHVGDVNADGVDDLLAVHGQTGSIYAALGGADGFTNRMLHRAA